MKSRAGSCRPTGIQDSIDQPDGLRKSVVAAEAHFPVPYGVDGGVDSAAELLQLLGAEDEAADRRLASAEHEVVGAELRDLDLRLLDREQVLDGLGQRSVAILECGGELAQLVVGLRQGEAAMDVDTQRLRSDVLLRDVCVDARVDANRAGGDAPLALQLRDRLVEQLDVQLEPDGGDVPGLLRTQQLAGPADLEAVSSERPTRPRIWYSWASPSMSARSTTSVFACGMSIPDSMIVVDTRTSASPRRNVCIFSSSSFSRICPCATRKRRSGQSCRSFSAATSIVSTRLCR